MKTPKTEYQKALEILTSKLNLSANRIKSAYSFNKLKTFKDLKLELGFSETVLKRDYSTSELLRSVTFNEVKDLLADESLSLRTALWLKYNPPDISDLEQANKELTEFIVEEQTQLECVEEHQQEYGFVKRPDSRVFHYWFQKKAIVELKHKLAIEKKQGIQLISGTGTGKTFIIAELLRQLWDEGFFKACPSPWPVVWITKAPVVEQTKRVLRDLFGFDTTAELFVIGIDQLRSKFGKLYVEEKITVVQGEEHITYVWRPLIHPMMIIWDESQAVKNVTSTQSKIAQAYNEIQNIPTYQVFVSATPFTRVCEAKCFCVATRIQDDAGLHAAPLSNKRWPDFANWVAAPMDITEHSPAAIDRLMTKMDDYIVRCKGIKWQYQGLNSTKIVDFDNEEDRKFYHAAWERYLKEKAKMEALAGAVNPDMMSMDVGVNKFLILAQFTKFRQASELCHARRIVDGMIASVNAGQAACSALNFKHTIIKAVKILIEEYDVPRDKISLIWGGGVTINKKAKQREELLNNPQALEALKMAGITLDDLDLGDDDIAEIDKIVKDEKLPPEYRMGAQNAKQRQEEIDRFQRGDSLFCFFSFKAGGVGLSLHHTDEQTKEKVRRKESGYAFEEDIPKIPTRQRVCFLTPTYSAMELVQGLGRCPRLTSLSDTPQIVLFFRDTIEERVAAVVSLKLRCLSKVVRQRESWEAIILGAKDGDDSVAVKAIQEAEKQIELVTDNEDDAMLTLEEEEEE